MCPAPWPPFWNSCADTACDCRTEWAPRLTAYEWTWCIDTAPVPSAVVVDYVHGESTDTTPLIFGGWNVIHIGPGEDLAAAVAANPGVFGEATR